MSKQTAATKVESAVNCIEGINSVDVRSIEGSEDTFIVSISNAVDDDETDESDDASPSNSNAVDEGKTAAEESGFVFGQSPSNSNAVEGGTDYPEGDDEEFACPLCGDYEGSKAQVSGHKGHCDGSPSNSNAVEGTDEENDDSSSSNSNAVDEEEVSDEWLLNNGVKKANLEAVRNYRSDGVCEDCGVYGVHSEDSKFCAGCKNNSDSSSNSNAVDNEESNADKVQQVMDLFGVPNSEAKTAVNAVENDLFATVKEALEA